MDDVRGTEQLVERVGPPAEGAAHVSGVVVQVGQLAHRFDRETTLALRQQKFCTTNTPNQSYMYMYMEEIINISTACS